MKKVKSGILFLILGICFIIGLILSFCILLYYYSALSVEESLMYDKACTQLNTIVNVLIPQNETTYTYETFNDTENNQYDSSLKVSDYDWGAYKVYHLYRKIGKSALEGVYLYGADSDSLLPSIYISDKGTLCVFTENNHIDGKAMLPGGVFKPVYQNRIKTLNLKLGKSQIELPYKKNLDKLKVPDFDSMIDMNPSFLDTVRSPFYHPFVKEEIKIISSDLLTISKSIQGRVSIFSRKGIIVTKEAKMEDVILIAPYVTINEGSTISCQIFATDSIIVQKGSKLLFPTLLFLSSKSMFNRVIAPSPIVRIGEQVNLKGTIIGLNPLSTIYLTHSSIIEGLIYSTGNLFCQGNIYGSVIANNIISQAEDKSLKSNYFDGVNIKYPLNGLYLPMPFCFKDSLSKLQLAKKLY